MRSPGVFFAENVFSHPDYTVGSGIPENRSPDQLLIAGHGLYHR